MNIDFVAGLSNIIKSNAWSYVSKGQISGLMLPFFTYNPLTLQYNPLSLK